MTRKCEICNHLCKTIRGINAHLRGKHKEITFAQYQEKYHPKHCIVCKQLIKYKDKYSQYKYCNQKCLAKDFSNKYIHHNKGVKEYSEEELLTHLKELETKYQGYVTQRMVKREGKYCFQTYHSYFGRFTKACELAGVRHLKQHSKEPHKYKNTEEFIIKTLKKIYLKINIKLTYKLVYENSPITLRGILRNFGGLGTACDIAEVPYHLEDKCPNDKDTLLLKVSIDTREGKPYKFIDSVFKKLDVGDYCLTDFFHGVVFERKSISDLKSTMSGGSNTKRFGKEMERARVNGWYCIIIIDGSKKDFYKSKQYGRNNANSIMHFIKIFESVYADVCQFVFTGSRRNSMRLISLFGMCVPADVRCLDIQDVLDNPIDLFDEEQMRKLLAE